MKSRPDSDPAGDQDRLDPQIEKVIEGIRREAAEPALEAEACRRVWKKLSTGAVSAPGPIQGCMGFQSLIPLMLSNELDAPRRLLLEDHLLDCVACRKAFHERSDRRRPKVAAPSMLAPRIRFAARWAAAAAVLLAAGLGGYWAYDHAMPAGASTATVEACGGIVVKVEAEGMRSVRSGVVLRAGTELRTGRGGWAELRLPDGSRMELAQSSSVSFSPTRWDLSVRLRRGAMILEAAKRRRGHLYVMTPDARISVTGTVFSVESGIKGSRVAVVEGEVRVAHNNREEVLRPGSVFTTARALSATSAEDAIAWSRNLDRHLALLKAANALGQDLQTLRFPDLRYSSRLLSYAPADTAFYAAFPNLTHAFNEALEMVQQRARENEVVRAWWESRAGGTALSRVLPVLRAAGEYLGPEIAVLAVRQRTGAWQAPVALAEVRSGGFRQFLESQPEGSVPHMVFAGNAAEIPSRASGALFVLLKPELVAASPDPDALRSAAAVIEAAAPSFAGSELERRLAASYREGAGILVAADLRTSAPTQAQGRHETGRLAIGDPTILLFERKDAAGQSQTRAAVSFASQRTGVASWLAEPGASEALEYVSPDANFAAAALMKNPAEIVRELFGWIERGQPGFREELSRAEIEFGFSLERDLAASLGGDFAIALDGPLLPVPSWKLVAEVRDPAAVDAIFARLAEVLNRHRSVADKPVARFTQEQAGGRHWRRLILDLEGSHAELCYTYANGYLLAAPSRALLERTLQNQEAGISLSRSQTFTSLLPPDRFNGFSAAVYYNGGEALSALFEKLAGGHPVTPQQGQTMLELAREMKPALAAVYAGKSDLVIATTCDWIDLGVRHLLGVGGPLALIRVFGPEQQRSEPMPRRPRMKY